MSKYYQSILNAQGSSFSNTKSFFTSDPIVPLTTTDGIDFLSLSTKVSFSFWFKANGTANATIPLITMVAGRATQLRLQITDDPTQNESIVQLAISSTIIVSHTISNFSDWSTAWHHIILSYDNTSGNGDCTVFLDGVNLNVSSIGAANFLDSTFFAQPNIGQGTGTLLSGYYTQIGIWDTNLTNSEMTAIYNSGCPSDISSYSPEVWLKIDDAVTQGEGISVPNSGSASGTWSIAGSLGTYIVTDSPC
jgi:hypothetical protein